MNGIKQVHVVQKNARGEQGFEHAHAAIHVKLTVDYHAPVATTRGSIASTNKNVQVGKSTFSDLLFLISNTVLESVCRYLLDVPSTNGHILLDLKYKLFSTELVCLYLCISGYCMFGRD